MTERPLPLTVDGRDCQVEPCLRDSTGECDCPKVRVKATCRCGRPTCPHPAPSILDQQLPPEGSSVARVTNTGPGWPRDTFTAHCSCGWSVRGWTNEQYARDAIEGHRRREHDPTVRRHDHPDGVPLEALPTRMRRVIVESPYAGDVARNEAYARAALADCLHRGEAPYASHLLYTQPGVLDDTDPAERTLGIEAGLEWGRSAEATVVYTDLGVSRGMQMGIDRARDQGRPVEFRTLTDQETARS